MEWIKSNPNLVTLIILLVIVLIIAVMYYFGKKKEAKYLVYCLVLQAEKQFIHESGQGHLKYRLVLKQIVDAMPALLKVFITPDTLHEWIQEAWRLMKDVTDGIEGDSNV